MGEQFLKTSLYGRHYAHDGSHGGPCLVYFAWIFVAFFVVHTVESAKILL